LPEVVVELDLDANAVLDYHGDYLRLEKMDGLVKIYQDLRDDFLVLMHLYKKIKKEGLSKQGITNLLKNQNKLSELEERVTFYNEHIQGQISQKTSLERVIKELTAKRDNYDGFNL
jgi:Trp operon repressor